MKTTMLAAAMSLLLLATLALLALFLRATSGAGGLRQRIERLFHLPERTRARARDHYYQAYWRAH